MRTLANCEGGNCPQIDERDDGGFEIQGFAIDSEDKIGTPAGHDRIYVPRATLLHMIEQLLGTLAAEAA